ncbi:peptidase inhibitor family I36 protein [Actinoplanes sp. RD1]|uniref:peptidase inhibitor family I36 protein n=1 Tax=Actinoplanes sp. RD1 TaxID=3064538 RepID=UPI002741187C|nr:peptidase inhibitor family I36 protein [Actinoplanes sp. RD1]
MRIKTVVAGMIVAGAAALAPGVAHAALSDCDSNNMCMWGNNDFVFMIGERGHGSTTITNLSGDNNDEMDSWANRSASYTGCMYSNAGGGGDKQTMARNSNDNNVSPLNSDEVSSWRTANGC